MRDLKSLDEAYAAGLRRAQELAKERAEAAVVFECGECDGEGLVDDEDSDGEVTCPTCLGDGAITRRQKTIDWSAFDRAIEAEQAKTSFDNVLLPRFTRDEAIKIAYAMTEREKP